MYHNFLIHSSLDGYLACSQVLAIVKSAAVSFRVHVSFWIIVFSGYMPSSGIVGSYNSFIPFFFFFFQKASPYWLGQFTLPPTIQENSLFCTASPAFVVCRLFVDGHSDQCEVIFHCGFDLHLSNNERHWASFHVFVSHLYVFFGEMSV